MARLFGTDGVRGEANVALCPELAYRLGWAAVLYFSKKVKDKPLILIGRDTRISGNLFEAALAAGICSAGGRAEIVGVCPTPAVAYLARTHKAAAGIVISASHNPFYDNGIKFFGGDGYKLADAAEDAIEKLVRRIEQGEALPRATRENIAPIKHCKEYISEYVDFVQGAVDISLAGLKVVLDCANGAAYECMPRILQNLGADVYVINAAPDGLNINKDCGSTNLKALQETVLAKRADIGIAHDGDADRCLCVDEKGEIIDGDHMLVMCAKDMLDKGILKKHTVVTTVMANIGFHKALKEIGALAEITQVGDRYVLEKMRDNGYRLGGEQSGHIIFSDFSTTGDGLITALQVLAICKRTAKKASELSALMTSYPQLLFNVVVKTKEAWEKNEAIAAAIRQGEAELAGEGRILVRPSGTEPLIRVMAEGADRAQLEVICSRIAAVVKKEQG